MKNNYQFKDLVVHEDDDFIIINKPPLISTLEDRSSPLNVLELARSTYPDAKVCHRLDKETSGLLVIAKHDESYRYFSMQLENREVVKLYHAIVEGCHEIDEQELDQPLYVSSNRSRVDFYDGKPSLTLISTIEIYQKHTLLACMPFTGRLHQIRVHLAHQSLPICGDSHYGGHPIFLSSIKRNYNLSKGKEEQPLMQRLSLHAAGLSFVDPNGEKINIKAPYPKDFAATLRQLSKNKR